MPSLSLCTLCAAVPFLVQVCDSSLPGYDVDRLVADLCPEAVTLLQVEFPAQHFSDEKLRCGAANLASAAGSNTA